MATDKIKRAEGYVYTRFGKITVSYDETSATVTVPGGLNIEIDIPDKEVTVNHWN